MTSRYQDNFLHTSLDSKSSPSAHNSSVSSSNVAKDNNNTHQKKSTKWYNPANLLKISPEPINPWASNPFSSAEPLCKEDIRRVGLAGVRLQDQRRGYLGKERIVGYRKV